MAFDWASCGTTSITLHARICYVEQHMLPVTHWQLVHYAIGFWAEVGDNHGDASLVPVPDLRVCPRMFTSSMLTTFDQLSPRFSQAATYQAWAWQILAGQNHLGIFSQFEMYCVSTMAWPCAGFSLVLSTASPFLTQDQPWTKRQIACTMFTTLFEPHRRSSMMQVYIYS